jgi:hypothetical protein
MGWVTHDPIFDTIVTEQDSLKAVREKLQTIRGPGFHLPNSPFPNGPLRTLDPSKELVLPLVYLPFGAESKNPNLQPKPVGAAIWIEAKKFKSD